MYKIINSIYDMRELLNIMTILSKDDSLTISKAKIYIQLAHTSIRNYLNAGEDFMVSEDGTGKFAYEVAQLAAYIYDQENQYNVASKSQGKRAISYHSSTELPVEIKMLLPTPFAGSI